MCLAVCKLPEFYYSLQLYNPEPMEQTSNWWRQFWYVKYNEHSRKIDLISRVMFPAFFIIFNITVSFRLELKMKNAKRTMAFATFGEKGMKIYYSSRPIFAISSSVSYILFLPCCQSHAISMRYKVAKIDNQNLKI